MFKSFSVLFSLVLIPAAFAAPETPARPKTLSILVTGPASGNVASIELRVVASADQQRLEGMEYVTHYKKPGSEDSVPQVFSTEQLINQGYAFSTGSSKFVRLKLNQDFDNKSGGTLQVTYLRNLRKRELVHFDLKLQKTGTSWTFLSNEQEVLGATILTWKHLLNGGISSMHLSTSGKTISTRDYPFTKGKIE